jgi:glycine cleavage system aminomethyltransferase T
MDDLFLSGPDALRLLSDHAVNTFANFPRGSAKQYVAVNNDGHMIGDSILFHIDDGRYDLVGNPSVINWLLFHIEKDKYDVVSERCENSARRKHGPPTLYRYEIQGPTAAALMQKVTQGHQVLQDAYLHHCRQARADATAWYGRPAGVRDVRPVGGRHSGSGYPARRG